MDENDLIRDAKRGCAESFRSLVRRYEDRVLTLVHQFVGNRDESEDVAQEVFVKVYRKLDSFRYQSSFYTWLYRIAVNAATDHLKKRRRDPSVSLEALPPVFEDARPDDPAPYQSLLDEEVRERIGEAVEALPEPFKTVLILREFEDCTYEQIAEILDCSMGTVESRLFRARQRLREKLMSYLRP